MNCIDSYPQPTIVKDLIDDIHADPAKYKAIAANASIGKIIVIENIVAGPDIGIGAHEALKDAGVPCERVIFLNLPKSAENVDSILDYLYLQQKSHFLPVSGRRNSRTHWVRSEFSRSLRDFGAVFLCRRI